MSIEAFAKQKDGVTRARAGVGEATPAEAWEELKRNKNAYLVDVRTQAEWQFVGIPDLSPLNKRTLTVSWKLYPGFAINPQFAEQLAGEDINKESTLYFMCRSGGRSLDAAHHMSGLGYKHCYNMLGGFEGEPNEAGHRGVLQGWKAANLPWGQN